MSMEATPVGAVATTTARPRAPYADGLALIRDLHNHTVLAKIGPLVVTTYSIFIGVAFTFGMITALWLEAMSGRHPAESARLHLLLTLPIVFAGLRVFTIATEMHNLRQRPLETLIRPGFTLHGGMFGGAVALWTISSMTQVPVLFYLDCAALAMPLGESIGRLGCHVYGCCWGRPTTGPFGIRYTNPDASVLRNEPHLTGVRIHPTQLYTAIYTAVIFLVLLQLLPLRQFDGFLAASYAILHSIGRFAVERFRHDNRGNIGAGFTQTNLYSAIMIAAGVAMFAGFRSDTLTPTIHAVSWTAIAFDPGVLLYVAGFGMFFACVYGVGYKRVGAWLSA